MRTSWDTVRTAEDVAYTVASTRILSEETWVPGRSPARLCVVFSLLKEEFQLNRCSYLDLQYHLLFSSKVGMKTPASPLQPPLQGLETVAGCLRT